MPRSEGPVPRTNLRCTACGYGVLVRTAPERCPMCGGSAWEHAGLDVLGRVLQARVRGESPDVRALFRDVNVDIAVRTEGDELELVCECRDGRCFAAVGIRRDDFRALQVTPLHHVVLPGHEADGEAAVVGGPRFAIVTTAQEEPVLTVAEVQAHALPGQGRPRQ